MYEKIPAPTNREKMLDENIGETTVGQMNDIIMEPKFGLYPEDGHFSAEQSGQLSDWVKDNSENLEEILAEIGYYPEELTEANIKRLKLCLMTPRFIYAQSKRDRGSEDRPSAQELTEYREVLREAVLANPDMRQDELSLLLHGAVMWAGLPDSYRHSSGQIIDRAIAGVRGEVVMEQLARSGAAQAAGIVYENTSAEEDARGVDLRLFVPIQKRGEETIVPMGVDVKFDRRQILDLIGPDEEIKPYKIKNGVVVMWAGTTRDDLNGRMSLEQAAAEKKGVALTPILQQAATELLEARNQRRMDKLGKNLGHYGLRSA
jgi:hypothetical protein